MVKGTRFEGRENTSAPLQSDALNILALPAASAGLAELACNCAYLGAQVIVCDSRFMNSFSNAVNYNVEDPALKGNFAKLEQVNRRWLLSWLIGHEIGHAVLHDGKGQFGRRLWSHRGVTASLEEQADSFFAQHVPPDERKRAAFVLTDFAFQALSFTYKVDASGHGQAVIAPSRDGIHPPWLLRALSVARTVSELNSGRGTGEDFYGGVLTNVRVDAKGVDIGTLCSAENLRWLAAERTRMRQNR